MLIRFKYYCKLLLLVPFVLLLASCNTPPVKGSVGSLSQNPDLLKDDEKTQGDIGQSQAVVEYSRFVSLFNTVSHKGMRLDGMRQLAALQKKYNRAENIPLHAVIALFEGLLSDYPLQKNDRLLYQLSREYEQGGQSDAALDSLNRLVGQYKKSSYYDEAQFRRGEILFTKRRYVEAEKAYQQVADFRDLGAKSVYYEQAIYKQAWSQFKLSQYVTAIDSFMHLLDLHAEQGLLKFEKMKSSEREFVDDVLRAINLSFSYQAGPVSAQQYFATKSKRRFEYQIYASLAEFYLQKDHYADAVKAYRLFVADNEVHRYSPRFLLRVIEIYRQGGFTDLLIEAKKDFALRYSVNSAYWGLYPDEVKASSFAQLKKNIQQLASHYHTLAQKSRSRLNYREAQRWYRIWLESFAKDPRAWEMNFLFAEILNEDKQYEAAVLQYERTAYDYKTHEKSAEAGYAALLAYEQYEQGLQGLQKRQWHQRKVDSSIRFAGEFPQHRYAHRVMTQALENLYQMGAYEKAHMIGLEVKQNIKEPALLVSLWSLLGHIEFEWNDFNAAEKSYAQAIRHMPDSHKEKQALIKKQAVAVYKQGEISRQKGDLKLAVKHFSRVKQVSTQVGLVANAEYDAATALIGLRDWVQAAIVLERFRKQNTKHSLFNDATRKLAVVYLEKGELEKASIEFERVAFQKGDTVYRMEALWQAAELAEQVGNTERAQSVYKSFVKHFAQPLERAIEARQRLVDINERKGDRKRADQWRVYLIKAEASGGKARTDRTAYLAAKASFALAEPVFDSYRKVKLSIPLKRSLKKKRSRMDKALKAYARAAAYKVPEVLTAATYRIAEIYQDLGLAIYNSERPQNLKQEELEQYDILLEEKAYPFEEKAIEFHEVNVTRFAQGLNGVWVWKSLEQLKTFLPVRYNKKERSDAIFKSIL